MEHSGRHNQQTPSRNPHNHSAKLSAPQAAGGPGRNAPQPNVPIAAQYAQMQLAAALAETHAVKRSQQLAQERSHQLAQHLAYPQRNHHQHHFQQPARIVTADDSCDGSYDGSYNGSYNGPGTGNVVEAVSESALPLGMTLRLAAVGISPLVTGSNRPAPAPAPSPERRAPAPMHKQTVPPGARTAVTLPIPAPAPPGDLSQTSQVSHVSQNSYISANASQNSNSYNSKASSRSNDTAGDGKAQRPKDGANNRKKKKDTLRDCLEQVRNRDARCVLITRRINKLGFKSRSILEQHYAQYGKVIQVLVAHSKVKTTEDKGMLLRTRPGNLGLVVMGSVEAAEAILAAGTVQIVSNVEVHVHRFEQTMIAKGEDDEEEEVPPIANLPSQGTLFKDVNVGQVASAGGIPMTDADLQEMMAARAKGFDFMPCEELQNAAGDFLSCGAFRTSHTTGSTVCPPDDEEGSGFAALPRECDTKSTKSDSNSLPPTPFRVSSNTDPASTSDVSSSSNGRHAKGNLRTGNLATALAPVGLPRDRKDTQSLSLSYANMSTYLLEAFNTLGLAAQNFELIDEYDREECIQAAVMARMAQERLSRLEGKCVERLAAFGVDKDLIFNPALAGVAAPPGLAPSVGELGEGQVHAGIGSWDEGVVRRHRQPLNVMKHHTMLRDNLAKLSEENPDCIVIVCRVHVFGLRARELLLRHFSQYGEVCHVYVPNKLATPNICANGQLRNRPGNRGFVVMRKPESVRAILSLGSECFIAGEKVHVEAFTSQKLVEFRLELCPIECGTPAGTYELEDDDEEADSGGNNMSGNSGEMAGSSANKDKEEVQDCISSGNSGDTKSQ